MTPGCIKHFQTIGAINRFNTIGRGAVTVVTRFNTVYLISLNRDEPEPQIGTERMPATDAGPAGYHTISVYCIDQLSARRATPTSLFIIFIMGFMC